MCKLITIIIVLLSLSLSVSESRDLGLSVRTRRRSLSKDLEVLNTWYKNNVDPNDSSEYHIKEAQLYSKDHSNELTSDEKKAIGLLVELESALKRPCNSESVEILRRNIDLSDVDLKNSFNRRYQIQRIVFDSAVEHAKKCEEIYKNQKESLKLDLSYKELMFLDKFSIGLYETLYYTSKEIEVFSPESSDLRLYLNDLDKLPATKLAKVLISTYRQDNDDQEAKSALKLSDGRADRAAIEKSIKQSLESCEKIVRKFEDLIQLAEFDARIMTFNNMEPTSMKDIYFIVKSCQRIVNRDLGELTETFATRLEAEVA